MQRRLHITIGGIFSGIIMLASMNGCVSLSKNVVSEIELRRKIDDWKEQIYSEDPAIRSSAAVSLLGLNLLHAHEPLLEVLRDKDTREEVKISVIKAFGFTRDDRATDVLIELLDSDSKEIQNTAINALVDMRSRAAIHKMTAALLDPKRSLKSKKLLAKALGNTYDRDVVESLIKVLMTSDAELREVAKNSLEKITRQSGGNNSAWWEEWWGRNKAKTREQWLEDIILAHEKNSKHLEAKIEKLQQEVAEKSIKLLENRVDKTDPKLLIEAIKSEYPDVRIFAAKELAKIKNPSVIDVLIDAASDKQEEVRIEMVRTLGEIDDERTVRPLIRALNDKSLAVREIAARALGRHGNPAAVDALISALDKNAEVPILCAIIDALGQIGDKQAVVPLIRFLSHKDPVIRENTAAALGKLKDDRAVEPLIAALNDEQERVRWYSADSLGKIGNPVCVPPLIKLLSDSSARVRESAVTALGQIGNQQSMDSLIKALQDSDKRVADQAADALVAINKLSFDVMTTVANAFYGKNDYRRAEIILNRQISRYAKQPEYQEKIWYAKIKLARTYLKLKDWQKAIVLYEELITRFPDDTELKSEFIQCLNETKRYDRSLEWYETWTKESPQDKQMYWQGRLDILRSIFDQGDYEKVVHLIEKFREMDPSLGGEKFGSQFYTLEKLCLERLGSSATTSKNQESEQPSKK